MNRHRLRLKVGEHEFEAEGAPEFIEHRFRAFEQLIRPPEPAPPAVPVLPSSVTPSAEQVIARVARLHKTTVYLTAKPPSIPAAALVLVLANQTLRSKDRVSGFDVRSGLTASGIKLPRVDRLLAQIAADGDLVVAGKNRKKRYGLTEAGYAKSRSIVFGMTAATT